MNKISKIKGDILLTDCQAIVHQTNCVTVGKAAGLAGKIFEKYPESDIYKYRQEFGVPGDITIFNSKGVDIVNLNGQFFPGGPKFNKGFDSPECRLDWFYSALLKLSEMNFKSVAFPYLIGCGLARGNWNEYNYLINFFAEENPKTKVVIHEL